MLKTILPSSLFERHIAAALSLCIFQFIDIVNNINLPFELLYGPVVYFCHKAAVGQHPRYIFVHLLPFIFFLLLYVLRMLFPAVAEIAHPLYMPGYVIAAPVSLLLYSLTETSIKSNNLTGNDNRLMSRMYFINIAVACFFAVKIFKSIHFYFSSGFDPVFIINGLRIVMALLVVHYFLQGSGVAKARPIKLSEAEAMAVADKLKDFLESSKIYLDAGLTLDMLSKKINIPKHHLSYCLNSYLQKNFYQLLAYYRIEYAKNRLMYDSNVTIENLALQCGFYSRTTFNKRFKESTGVVPSQYRTAGHDHFYTQSCLGNT